MRAILVVRIVAGVVALGAASGCAEWIGAAPRRAPVFVRRVTVPRFRLEDRATPPNTVALRVIDDSTGLPVQYTVVARLVAAGDSAVTDSVGHLELAHVAAGTYALELDASMFERRTDTVRVTPARGTSVEVRLRRVPAVIVAGRTVSVVAGP